MIAFLTGLSLWARLITLAGVIAAIIGAYALWHHAVYQNGYDKAITDIAAENQEAIDAANKARIRVRECYASGGNWDQSGGVCQR